MKYYINKFFIIIYIEKMYTNDKLWQQVYSYDQLIIPKPINLPRSRLPEPKGLVVLHNDKYFKKKKITKNNDCLKKIN